VPFLLAGCNWTGDAFYSASDAQTAIVAGDYRSVDSASGHAGPGVVHVAVLPDGMTRITPGDGDHEAALVGFVPLGGDRHFFIMWVSSLGNEVPPAGEIPYGLAEARPGGGYRLYLPDCSRDRAVAVASGATPTATPQPDCRFPDRAHLEAGFAAYARQPGEGMDLIPVSRN
jgi:hypothetical protein